MGENGYKRENWTTPNLYVELMDTNEQYGPIVSVILGNDCVKTASQNTLWKKLHSIN